MIIWKDRDGKTLVPGDWVTWVWGGEDQREVRQVASEEEYAEAYPGYLDDKNEWVPIRDYHEDGEIFIDGWGQDACQLTEPLDFKRIDVGDRVEIELDGDIHKVLIVDFYTDPRDGIVIQSRYGNFAQNEGWRVVQIVKKKTDT